ARDHWHVAGRVFEINADGPLAAIFSELVIGDVTLILEDLGDVALQPRCRHVYLRMTRGDSIANARQHVGDRIGCCHSCTLLRISIRLLTMRPFTMKP